LVSAWLLQDRHDVVLLEHSATVGGNWHTVSLDGRPVDVAASAVFSHYDHVVRLARALEAPLDPVGRIVAAGLWLFCAQPRAMFGYGLAFAWLLPLWGAYLASRALGRTRWLAQRTWGQLSLPSPLRPYVEKWLVLSAVAAPYASLAEVPLLGPLAYSWANLSSPLFAPSWTPRAGFGDLAQRLLRGLHHTEVRTGQTVRRIERSTAGGWTIATDDTTLEADAVFAALPPWRLRDVLVTPNDSLADLLAPTDHVVVPVVVHREAPTPWSHRLLFYLSDRFVSYRLRPTEPFRSMTATGVPATPDDPVLYTQHFETDRFTAMAGADDLHALSGADDLWLVHSAFHPSGSRNSEQAVALAVDACHAFDPTLPRLPQLLDAAAG